MNRRLKLFVAAAAVAAAPPALAHHSGAMFDAGKSMTVTGVVKAYRWQNPHGSIVLVSMASEDPAQWTIELSTPNILVRKGWTGKSFAPGDKVTVVMHPMKDGGKAGLLMHITDAKGSVLKDHDY